MKKFCVKCGAMYSAKSCPSCKKLRKNKGALNKKMFR